MKKLLRYRPTYFFFIFIVCAIIALITHAVDWWIAAAISFCAGASYMVKQ